VDVARRFLNQSLKTMAQYVADEIRRAAPVGRTTGRDGPTGGELRRSIGTEKRKAHQNKQSRFVVGINPRAFYWKFIEFGTKPHTIKGRKGKFLSFGGKQYRSVKHPGLPARPFIRPTWDRVKTNLPRMFMSHLKSLLRAHKLT
jgi:HK97 gp10 family phage protein